MCSVGTMALNTNASGAAGPGYDGAVPGGPVLLRAGAARRRSDALCRQSFLLGRTAISTRVRAVENRYFARCSRAEFGHGDLCQRVLVIDDTPNASDVIAQVLAAAGFWVYGARSYDEGFQVLEHSNITLLILDLSHSSLGLSLLDLLEATTRLPQVIGLTGDRWDCPMDPRIFAVLGKPFEVNDLLALVAGVASV
jgi:CheY-like chemotaxis protein